VKGQMPSLGRAQQPSRQCTKLGTTPERIKEKCYGSRGEKARLLLPEEAGVSLGIGRGSARIKPKVLT